jgi:hypothetical protein
VKKTLVQVLIIAAGIVAGGIASAKVNAWLAKKA